MSKIKKYLNEFNFKCFLRFLKNRNTYTSFRENAILPKNEKKLYSLNYNLIDECISWSKTYEGFGYWHGLYMEVLKLNKYLIDK